MKWPRFRLASLAFTILVLAFNLGVIRGAFVGESDLWVFDLWSLPMIDILTIGFYRLRLPARRSAGAVGFISAGCIATAGVLAFGVVAPNVLLDLLTQTVKPVARSIFNGSARLG